MDITVTPAGDGKTWQLTDLLGRSMGFIEQVQSRFFFVRPSDRSLELLGTVSHPASLSLDEAMSAIEKAAPVVRPLFLNDSPPHARYPPRRDRGRCLCSR